MDVHPSQRRLSCEVCRKNKKKCIREGPEGLKCVRCISMGFSCDAGEQRKVGRPKGKRAAPASSSDAPPPVKRQRHAKDNNFSATASNVPHGQSVASQYDALAFPVTIQAPPLHMHSHEEQIHRRNASSYAVVAGPRPTNAAFEVPSWPTFMTDSWYRNVRSKDTPAQGTSSTTDLISRGPFILGTARYNAIIDPASLSLSIRSSAIFNGSARPSVSDRSPKKSGPTTALDGKRLPTYYINGDRFTHCSDHLVFEVDLSNAFAQLKRMEQGLKHRRAIVQTHNRDLSLDMMIYYKGPLCIENTTMSSHILETSQDLIQILAGILHQYQTGTSSSIGFVNRLVPAGVKIYCQLLAFYELFIELLTTRLERTNDPMIPIPGITLNDVPVTVLSAQGALFCNTSLTLLEKIDVLLGTGTQPGRGLLSTTQVDSLQEALDAGDGMTSEKGIMRPADMKMLYVQVRDVLEKVTIEAQ